MAIFDGRNVIDGFNVGNQDVDLVDLSGFYLLDYNINSNRIYLSISIDNDRQAWYLYGSGFNSDLTRGFCDSLSIRSQYYGSFTVEGFSWNLSENLTSWELTQLWGKDSDTVYGSEYSDSLNTLSGSDVIYPGGGNDLINGGTGFDKVILTGNHSSYKITKSGTQTIIKDLRSGSPDGENSLYNIEEVQFNNRTLGINELINNSVSYDPKPYELIVGSLYGLSSIKDYDGNAHGYLGYAPADVVTGYKFQGKLDANKDGITECIFTNKESGRWVTASIDSITGQFNFYRNGWGGTTRVVGIYQDPLVAAGIVQKDSAFDGSRTFINDLKLDNLILKAADDFDKDGFQEIYWSKVDNSAYLRAVMHADGNIQYANYQNLDQMTDYLTGHGFADTVALIA